MDPPAGTPLPLDRPCVLRCERRARLAAPDSTSRTGTLAARVEGTRP
jgi:hypothetical protein